MKLEPCPFEGQSCDPDLLVERSAPFTTKFGQQAFKAWVECKDCGARGPKQYGSPRSLAKEAAVYSWNERTPREADT